VLAARTADGHATAEPLAEPASDEQVGVPLS
jgi:hypothetical protein